MLNTPFQLLPLRKTGFLRSILKQQIDVNALIELNNLLAAFPVNQINTTAISDIERKYNIDLHKTFTLNMQEFYAVYLQFSLDQQKGNPVEQEDLPHLQRLLKLSHEEITSLHIKIGESFFRDAVAKTIANGIYSIPDRNKLETLADNLKLPKHIAMGISLQLRQEYVKKQMLPIFSKKRLSSNEKMDLLVLGKNMNIDILNDDLTKKQLQEFENYWRLENEPLPIVTTDIELTKNEICHFHLNNVSWYEDRAIGNGKYQPKLIQKGTLYLTTKQLVFVSDEKTSKIRMDKITRIVQQKQGVEIIKDAGRNPTLHLADRAEMFSIILQRLVNQKI
ncbi:hypothetical protein ACDQ55_15480 [Chitinophaga sp. 30R24]|uniref:hypothetical protein n=1 Tax=Chitinophaga sp. 30R24 TaxID=3248838 RepID=UPI003B915A44